MLETKEICKWVRVMWKSLETLKINLLHIGASDGGTGAISVEESEDLATSVAGTSLLVVHDAEGSGQDDEAELTAGEDVLVPLLELANAAIVAGADGTALVEAAVQGHDDLAGAVVIDDLEGTDVAVLLHDLQELHDDLAGGADEDLALAVALSGRDGLERVSENGHHGHAGLFSHEERKKKRDSQNLPKKRLGAPKPSPTHIDRKNSKHDGGR